MDKHDLIIVIKKLCDELGKVPTTEEFSGAMKGAMYKTRKLYGANGYSKLLQDAGIHPEQTNPYLQSQERKIDNKIFETSLEKHLENYESRPVIERLPYPTIAVISDIHWPFENQKVVNRFYEYVADVKPEYVIINGDAWDNYSHSRFPKSHNVFTPREEYKLSRQKNEDFWNKIKEIHPDCKKYQLLGNHSIRPLKQILEHYPEAEDWIAQKLKESLTFDGVETIYNIRQELILNDIAIFHGYRSKLGDHRDFTQYNCINGHTHKGGVVFKQIRGQVLWELNSGLAGDPEGKGLTYTPQKISEWTPGFGAVAKYGPIFIHL